MRLSIAVIILVILASIAGGVFILKKERRVVIENIPDLIKKVESPKIDVISGGSTSTAYVVATSTEEIAENLISQVEILISETQEFIEQERLKLAMISQAREKSSHIKGVYAGAYKNFSYFKNLINETELNAVVTDIKEAYGINLSPSLKNSISEFHQKDIWVIARIVVFRDSSLILEKPGWYLTITTTTEATTTTSLWQDDANQYWLDPKNDEVSNYIIEFSKKAIDYGFDELQFDYIRYPDDYEEISGQEKIAVIGDFFSKLSNALRSYKPSIILSADLFGYVATQFNSYGTGQRLFDAGKYFDYISFMLYPSHFYGGFAGKGITYFYPDVVEHPYEVVYYSVFSARDYLALFGSGAKIRPWLQDFDLRADRDRGVFYGPEKVRLQIEGAENAMSSGWLLWNPSNIYTKEALGVVE